MSIAGSADDAILLIPPRDGEYRQDGLLEDRNVLKHFLESAGIPAESAFYKDYQVVQQSRWKMQQLLLHMPAARAAPRATAAAATTIEDSGQVAAAAATPAMAARRMGFVTTLTPVSTAGRSGTMRVTAAHLAANAEPPTTPRRTAARGPVEAAEGEGRSGADAAAGARDEDAAERVRQRWARTMEMMGTTGMTTTWLLRPCTP